MSNFVVSIVVSDGLAYLWARPSAHDDDQVRFPYIYIYYIYIYIYIYARSAQSYTLYSNES